MKDEIGESGKQFHLGLLPTDRSNPATASLEEDFRRSTLAGVACLQRADRQVALMARHVLDSDAFARLVESAVKSVSCEKGRIVFSGCGTTGRLAILLESMWREFFHCRMAELTSEEQLLADRVVTVVEGGDYTLVRSDVSSAQQTESRCQARGLDVGEDDTVIALAEGRETSFVLDTLDSAVGHGARCYLLVNDPARLLRERFERFRKAIDNPKITVVDLYCGSMSVTGSTRLQAVTSGQLVCSCALEAALTRVLRRFAAETADDYTVAFESLLSGLETEAGRKLLAEQVDFEREVYENGGRVTYLADTCMLDLLIDTVERSQAFMIPSLRSSREKDLPQSWAFVKNPLCPTEVCWSKMLRRRPGISREDRAAYRIGNEIAPERIEDCPRAEAVIVDVTGANAAFGPAAAKLAFEWPESRHFDLTGLLGETVPSALGIWLHLAVKLAFNCISNGTMSLMGRIAGNSIRALEGVRL